MKRESRVKRERTRRREPHNRIPVCATGNGKAGSAGGKPEYLPCRGAV